VVDVIRRTLSAPGEGQLEGQLDGSKCPALSRQRPAPANDVRCSGCPVHEAELLSVGLDLRRRPVGPPQALYGGLLESGR
jgi:hypothetical protein